MRCHFCQKIIDYFTSFSFSLSAAVRKPGLSSFPEIGADQEGASWENVMIGKTKLYFMIIQRWKYVRVSTKVIDSFNFSFQYFLTLTCSIFVPPLQHSGSHYVFSVVHPSCFHFHNNLRTSSQPICAY